MERTLTTDELDKLTGLAVLFTHAADIVVTKMQETYELQYRKTNEYKALCKKNGKPQADEIVKGEVRRILRHDEKFNVGQWLKKADELHTITERITARSMECIGKAGECDMFKSYDYLMTDANNFCRLALYLYNIPDADYLKFESTMKAMAKEKKIAADVIEDFRSPEV